jgi:glucose-6-phosphate dehydrogenase assembly protein OpcA
MGERASRHYRIIIDPNTPRDVADVYRDHLREVTRTYLSEEESMVRDNVLSRSACRPTTPWRVMGKMLIDEKIKNDLDISRFS